jgi:hypothetical protein
VRRISIVTAVVALSALIGLGATQAQVGGATYDAVAAADGTRMSVTSIGYLYFESVLDAGIPSAHALVDSLGNSRAYAANPYPGDTVLYGLAQGATQAGANGLDPSAFGYPLIASTSNPSKKQSSVDSGPTSLRSRSGDAVSTATAAFGIGSGENNLGRLVATATASRDASTGTVTALSTNTIDGIAFGEMLRIGSLRSMAKVVRPPGGQPQREASLQISGLEVAGQPVGVDDKGAPHALTDPVIQSLEQNGITMRYIAAQNDGDGIVAAGLQVIVEREVSGVAPVIVSYVFGRASAYASNSGRSRREPAPIGETAPPPASSGESIGGAPVPSIEVPGSQVQPAPAPSAPPLSQSPVAGAAAAPAASTESIFLLIIVAAVAATGGAQLIRIFGVRTAWKSTRGEAP